MQPYSSLYATNVIEIPDSSFTQSHQPTTSMHHADPFSPDSIYKKRRMERACDACRRRKTKCNGPRMPDNICTNCIQNRKTCSYAFVQHYPYFTLPDFFPLARRPSLEDLQRRESVRPSSLCRSNVHVTAISPAWRTGWKRWKPS